MNEDDYLKLLAHINISQNRCKIMEYLHQYRVGVPRDISHSTGIRSNHISNILTDLKTHDLVECINPENRKGRLYRLTTTGAKVMDYYNELIQKR